MSSSYGSPNRHSPVIVSAYIKQMVEGDEYEYRIASKILVTVGAPSTHPTPPPTPLAPTSTSHHEQLSILRDAT